MGSVRQDKAIARDVRTQCPDCRESLTPVAQLSLSFCPHCRFPLMEIAGKYTLQQRLATGGFGAVYLAHHKDLTHHPERVIKIVKAELFATASIRERFQREVQITAQLSQESPHIVRVYDDFGECDKLGYYYVMEYLHGRSLRSLLEASQGPLPPSQISHLFAQLCDAIQTAHDAQILHRDLKPENIVLISHRGDPHFLKVLDFGIAKPMQHEYDSLEAVTEDPLGTPAYMAPEQCLNRDVGPHTDIYALGVLLYELLTGVTPFPWKGRDGLSGLSVSHNLLYAHIHQPPPPLHLRRPKLAEVPALEVIVQKALAKQPQERYHSAKELWQALQPVLTDDALLLDEETTRSQQAQPSAQSQPTPAHRQPWAPTLAPEASPPAQPALSRVAWMAHTEDAPQAPEHEPQDLIDHGNLHLDNHKPKASLYLPTAPPGPRNDIEDADAHQHEAAPQIASALSPVKTSQPKSMGTSNLVLPTASTPVIQPSQTSSNTNGRTAPEALFLEADRPSRETRHSFRIAVVSLFLFAVGSALGLLYYRTTPHPTSPNALAPLYRDPQAPPTQRLPQPKKAKAAQRRTMPRLLSVQHPTKGSLSAPQTADAQRKAPIGHPTRARTLPPTRYRPRPRLRRRLRHVRRPSKRRHDQHGPRQAHHKPRHTIAGRQVKQCPRLAGYYWVYVRFLSTQQRRSVQPVLPAGGRRKRLGGGDCFGVKKPSHYIAFGRSARGYIPCHLFPGKTQPAIQLKLQKEGDGLEPDTKTYCIK